MNEDDTQGRGSADRGTLQDRRAARQRARQNRKAQRKSQRRAENAPMPAERKEPRRPGVPAAPASSNPVGPLARRVGRIGGNMVLKRIMKMLLGAVLRR